MDYLKKDTGLVSEEVALHLMTTCGYPPAEISKVMSNYFPASQSNNCTAIYVHQASSHYLDPVSKHLDAHPEVLSNLNLYKPQPPIESPKSKGCCFFLVNRRHS
jgi:hypothetical protein